MKKQIDRSQWMNWLRWFLLGVAIIFVYKSFDKVSDIFSWFGTLSSILTPFIMAFAIAYFLSRAVGALERLFEKTRSKHLAFLRKRKRGFSVAIVYIVFIGLLSLLISLLIPQLVIGLSNLFGNARAYFDIATEYVEDFSAKYPYLAEFDIGTRLLDWAESFVLSLDIGALISTLESVANVGSTLGNIVVGIFVSIYMLLEKEHLMAAVRRICSLFLSEHQLNSAADYLHRADGVVFKYFTGQFLDCCVVSVCASIALAILGAPSPLVLGFLFGMFNIIPYFGPIISGVVVVFVILVTRGFSLALWSTIVLLIIQQLDANILNPKILGDSLDMSPFWVIFAVTVGGAMFSIGGMLLSVPVLAILRLGYRDLLAFRRRKQRITARMAAREEAKKQNNAKAADDEHDNQKEQAAEE